MSTFQYIKALSLQYLKVLYMAKETCAEYLRTVYLIS